MAAVTCFGVVPRFAPGDPYRPIRLRTKDLPDKSNDIRVTRYRYGCRGCRDR